MKIFLAILFISFFQIIVPSQAVAQRHFVSHYDNGQKESEGYFYKNYKVGNWKSWYETGTLKSNENFLSDQAIIDKIEQKGIMSLGVYDVSVAKYFIEEKGFYSGVSSWYFPNGQIAAEETWDKKLIKVKHWNEQGAKEKVNLNNRNWMDCIADWPILTKPLSEIIRKNKLNKKIRDGRALGFSFIVDGNGNIGSINYKEDKNDSVFERNELKLINATTGLWIAGKEHNLPKNYKVSLPCKEKGTILSIGGTHVEY